MAEELPCEFGQQGALAGPAEASSSYAWAGTTEEEPRPSLLPKWTLRSREGMKKGRRSGRRLTKGAARGPKGVPAAPG